MTKNDADKKKYYTNSEIEEETNKKTATSDRRKIWLKTILMYEHEHTIPECNLTDSRQL